MAYSIGIGVLASSFPWLHHNPLLSAGIAVVFAIVLGVLIDHLLRWWHKRLGRHDTSPVPSETEYATEPASGERASELHGTMLAGPSAESGASGK
ncbi:hypothetical protein SRABI128_05082 [Microbacterium sp. Bi128]|nr:hypothetical protein SRABI128_05082 [Microbacterium sp. Bi128]